LQQSQCKQIGLLSLHGNQSIEQSGGPGDIAFIVDVNRAAEGVDDADEWLAAAVPAFPFEDCRVLPPRTVAAAYFPFLGQLGGDFLPVEGIGVSNALFKPRADTDQPVMSPVYRVPRA
jgi:hypothetical protein